MPVKSWFLLRKGLQVLICEQDVSAAVLYLTAKVSASPRSLRSITNVYAYLLSPNPSSPESYYLPEGNYVAFRTRILLLEGLVLNALSFDLHVALPHALAITYLQTLALFPEPGPRVAKRTIQYLNTALLSPQMLYLTHQPNALAVAAIYLAAKDENVKLPEVEWWEVFDVDREELGFLVMGMGSLLGTVKNVGKKMITNADIPELVGGEDEETKMARLLDEKVGDT